MAKKVVSIRYFTARIQDELHSRILTAVEEWQKDWCLNPQPISVTVSPNLSTDSGASTIVGKSGAGRQLVLLQQFIDWKTVLFGDSASQAPEDEVCDSLIDQARCSLFSALYCSITGDQVTVDVVNDRQSLSTALPSSIHGLGIDSVMAHLAIGSIEFTLIFSLNAVGKLESLKVNKPRSALRKPDIKDITGSIRADVNLAFGTHRVSDICNLDVGDILISETGLDELLSVSIDGSALAKVRACRQGKKKAIMLVHPGK